MGQKVGGGATLEIQLIADVARLQRDMAAMKSTINSATVGAGKSFDDLARGSAASAAAQAVAAQKMARSAMSGGAAIKGLGASTGFARMQLLELGHVATSLSGSLIAGQNPLRAFAMELPRIGQVAATSGGGLKGLMLNLGQMAGLIKVVRDAELDATAATTAAGAAAVQKQGERAAAILVTREAQVALLNTELEAAAGTEAETAAMARLVKAQRAVADQSAALAGITETLAGANAQAAASAEAASAAASVGIGAMAGIATGAAVAIGLIAAAFEGVKQSAASDEEMKRFAGTLGLTEKQMGKLKDVTVTWGDVAKATFEVLAEKAGIDTAKIKSFFSDAFKTIGDFGKFSIAVIIAAFAAGFTSVKDTWKNLPGLIGEAAVGAANLAIAAIEKLANLGVSALNSLADRINNSLIGHGLQKAFGVELPHLAEVSLGRIHNQFAGTFAAVGKDISATFHSTFNAVEGAFDQISARSTAVADDRLRAQAAAIRGDDAATKSNGRAAAAHRDHTKAVKEEADAYRDLFGAMTVNAFDTKHPPKLPDVDLKSLLPDLPDLAKQMEEALKAIGEQGQITGQILSDAFGKPGDVLGRLIVDLNQYGAAQQQISDQLQAKLIDEATAERMLGNARAQVIGTTLSGLKSLFAEHSAGYKIMSTIEKGYAILQTVNAIRSMALDKTKTASSIGNSLARAAADGVAAIAKAIASLPFPLNIAAGAATAAALIAFGVKVFGHGGGSAPSMPDIKDVQAATGTGTVLGDNSAQSQSIANSLTLMAKNSTKGLDQTSSMVQSLRNIETGIGALTAAVARQLQVGGAFDSSNLGLGTKSGINTSPLSLLLFGPFNKKTVTTSLYDQGLQFNPASIQKIIEQGITGATYDVIQTVTHNSGFLGIGASTKTSYSTSTGGLPDDVAKQFQLITANLYTSVVDAAKMLGFDVGDALKQFQVDIGKISFKDLTGDQIQQELEAVFSKLGDQMAGFAVANLAQYQKAGEGLYETLMRVAKDFVTVGTALQSIGEPEAKIAKLSIAAREGLIDLMGGLDEFTSQINYFYENFLTQAQQSAFLQSQVDAAFTSLGIAEPTSIAAFTALVNGLDLTTDAGQATFAALMQIAPAFYQLETAAQQAADAAAAAAAQLAKQKTQLQIDLLNAQGKATEALALQRQTELAAMDASLRGLQQQIYAAQDLAKAKDNLLGAYQRESQELQATADKFNGFASDLRDFRASLFATTSGPDSYSASLIKLMQQSGLAAGGDETALGGGLKDAAQSFLDIATANAGTLADVARARALVARQIDAGIGGAEAQASLAEQQLDQMKDQVGVLIDINDSVLTVADALDAIEALLAPAPPSGGGGSAGGQPAPAPPPSKERREHDKHVRETLDTMLSHSKQAASAATDTATLLRRVTKQGTALIVATDDDTPLLVDSSGVELA